MCDHDSAVHLSLQESMSHCSLARQIRRPSLLHGIYCEKKLCVSVFIKCEVRTGFYPEVTPVMNCPMSNENVTKWSSVTSFVSEEQRSRVVTGAVKCWLYSESKQPLPWWACALHRVSTCFPLWLKGKGIKVLCGRSHSDTPHGGITVLSGLRVLLMQAGWKWLVCKEKLWTGQGSLEPKFEATMLKDLPGGGSWTLTQAHTRCRLFKGVEMERILLSEAQSSFIDKEITFKSQKNRNSSAERKWRRLSRKRWSWLEAVMCKVFTSGLQGQIGHIQVPQGKVKAGDCDCAAN